MRKISITNWIADRIEQLLQLLAIGIAMALPFMFDFQSVVKIEKPRLEIQELAIYYALRHGNICISVVIAVLMIMMFHSINAEKVLNKGNRYHSRSMFEYWICSFILGYKKCSLLRVPIADQYKLVLTEIFPEYITGDYEEAESDENVTIRKFGDPPFSILLHETTSRDPFEAGFNRNTVYIAVSDTYPITDDMLPSNCNENNTIIIQRETNKEDNSRYKSKLLVKNVLNVVRRIDTETVINILPTTNAFNTYRIVSDVFKTGRQDNIKHLYVYPQLHRNEKDWKFSEKGIKIF